MGQRDDRARLGLERQSDARTSDTYRAAIALLVRTCCCSEQTHACQESPGSALTTTPALHRRGRKPGDARGGRTRLSGTHLLMDRGRALAPRLGARRTSGSTSYPGLSRSHNPRWPPRPDGRAAASAVRKLEVAATSPRVRTTSATLLAMSRSSVRLLASDCGRVMRGARAPGS